MKKPTLVLLVMMAVELGGCVAREKARVNLGTIAIVSGGGLTNVVIPLPMNKQDATAAGATKGAEQAFEACLGAPPFGLLAAPVLIPLAAVIGSAEGHAWGMSAAEMEEAMPIRKQLKAAILGADLPGILRQDMVQAADSTPHPLVVVEAKQWPQLRGQADYHSLTNDDINTVLEVTVRAAGLTGQGVIGHKDKNVQRLAFLETQFRLIRVCDGAEIYNRTRRHESDGRDCGRRKFAAWGYYQCRPLREELARLAATQAELTVRDLLMTPDAEPAGAETK